MDCSIIIVNWNTVDLLSHCLDAVAAQALAGYRTETIVVDNGSTDGSQQLIHARYPMVPLIENTENLGFARANNQAIQTSNGNYLLLLNSDAFLGRNSLANMLSIMEQHSEIGILGPRLVSPDGSPQCSHAPLPSFKSELISLLGLDGLINCDAAGLVETGYVSGACFLIRREVINQIGMLDEDYFFFTEEADFCARAKSAGWVVAHFPGADVVHLCGASTGHNADRILLLYKGKLLYFSKHLGESACGNLFIAMRYISLSKLVFYRFIRLFSLGRVCKDILWQQVVKGLQTV